MAEKPNNLDMAAYGGERWLPREKTLQQELGTLWARCGISTEWAPLKSVLLHRPGNELGASIDPNSVQMLAPVDINRAQEQHDTIAKTFQDLDVTVNYLAPEGTPLPNQMFMADLLFATPEGVIIARPASEVRAGEEWPVAGKLAEMKVPILRTISGRATFEGADAMWINPKKVIIGKGLRTNAEGAAQVTSVLNEMGVETIIVDLPSGAMHLMGTLRIVDRDLAIAWPKRFPDYGVKALQEENYKVVFIPDIDEAINGYALNFVTVRPREIVMPAGNPVAQAFYEDLGITCHPVEVDELCKAAGAIGCLTGVLHRK